MPNLETGVASNEYALCQSLVPALGVRVIPKAQVTCLRQKVTKAHETVRSLPFLHLPVQTLLPEASPENASLNVL